MYRSTKLRTGLPFALILAIALVTAHGVMGTAVDSSTAPEDGFFAARQDDEASRQETLIEEERGGGERPADVGQPVDEGSELLGEVGPGGGDRPDPPAEAPIPPLDQADPEDPRHPHYVCTFHHPTCGELCLPFPPIEDVWEWEGQGFYLVEEGVGQYWATPGTCCLANQPTSCGENEGFYRPADSDGDGWLDDEDLCPNHYDLTDPQPDLDQDGLGDGCDLCPDIAVPSYPFGVTSWNHFDLDGDGYGDECDADKDGDLIDDDSVDICPDHYNPLEVDTDGDGIADAQRDTDGDGFGDACDDDDDDDCILDAGFLRHDGDGWRSACQDNDGDGYSEVEGDCDDSDEDDDNDNVADGFDISPGTADCTHPDCRWTGLVTVDGFAADNCDLTYNPGQEDADSDGYGDACDSCPQDPKDLCTPGDTFCELANIHDDAVQCSTSGFAVVEDCYDLDLPPSPAIRRAFIPTDPSRDEVHHQGYGRRLPETWEDQFHSTTEAKVADFPRHRATPDGRLSTATNGDLHPTFEVFYPENLEYGAETHGSRRVYADGEKIPVAARYFPPVTVNTALQHHRTPRMTPQHYADDVLWETMDTPGARVVWSDLNNPEEWPSSRPNSLNWDLCDGDDPAPFACTASQTVTGVTRDYEGQCYLNTLLFTNRFDHGGGVEQWELRSVDTVVFVGSHWSAPLHLPNSNPQWGTSNQILVFPRAAFDAVASAPVPNGTTVHLGSYDPWNVQLQMPNWSDYADWIARGGVPYVTHENFMLMVEDECLDTGLPSFSPPQWCEWADEHEVRRSFIMEEQGGTVYWGGEPQATLYSLLEPATTEDGRLLAMHINGSIRYSYNDGDSCAAREWDTFYPLSHAHHDPDLFDSPPPTDPKYGFAAEPLRWPTGHGADQKAPSDEKVLDMVEVPGSYPWISAKGEVVAWPMANTQFGWKPEWVYSGGQDFNDTTCPTQHSAVTNADLNVNTVGAVVAGSWTRGKIVLMDNMINYSNFQGSEFHASEFFRMPLYDDTDVFVRAQGIALLNSLEAQVNHIEAASPLSPFDVVWLMSSNAHQTGELVFDDYLHPRAYVIGHMNETLRNFTAYGVKVADGFSEVGDDATTPHDDSWRFRHSPTLQNASTFTDQNVGAPAMRLLGGAFVPPVAEGGVQGKGVFLDGVNDHIEVGGLHTGAEDDFLVSIWLESHAADPTEARVLLSLGDGSYVTVKDGEVKWKQGLDTLTWSGVPLANGTRYTHYALAVYDLGAGPQVRLYVDGNRVESHGLPLSVDHSLPPSLGGLPRLGRAPGKALYVGKSGYYPLPLEPPVRGWVDELRVYGLDTTVTGHEVEEPFFHEWVCNRALGSLTGTASPTCEQLDFRYADPHVAPDGWQYAGVSTLPIGDGQDFAIQAYTHPATCANQAHRSPDDALDCVRDARLGIPTLASPMDIRPDATTEAFCQTCHEAGHPTEGLQVAGPLGYTGVTLENDPRRQPLMWRPTSGYLPAVYGMSWGQPGTPLSNDFPADLDDYVLINGKVAPRP